MRGDARVFDGGEFLASGQAVHDLATALDLVLAAHRGTNGGGRMPRLAELLDVLREASARTRAFADESSKVSYEAVVSPSALADPITPKEAATMLDRTEQRVTEMCRAAEFASARQLGRRWLMERADVLAIIEGKVAS